MKLLSFMANGESLFGVVSGDGVIAMNRRVGCKSLREALAAGLLPQIKAATEGAAPDHKLSAITFLPVIPDPELITCAGINYRSHASETGREVPHVVKPRRSGDPAYLVADPTAAREVLNFRPAYSDLATIIRTAWGWHQKAHPLKTGEPAGSLSPAA